MIFENKCLLLKCCLLSIEAANTCTEFIIFGLTQPRLEPMIYHTQGDNVNNYNTDTVCTCDKGR